MPYNIADPGRDVEDLVVRKAKVFRETQGIDLRTGHRVDMIDPENKAVMGENFQGEPFELYYDKLLIATGASPIMPDLPGFNLPGVIGLRTLDQGRRIKKFIRDQNVSKAVIIGMGFIALEMCEALRTRNIEVDMVKSRPIFLPWMNEKLSSVIKEVLEANNINLFPGHQIKRIEKRYVLSQWFSGGSQESKIKRIESVMYYKINALIVGS